jgi:hypothetical protein
LIRPVGLFWVFCVVQVEASATGRSLIQGSLTARARARTHTCVFVFYWVWLGAALTPTVVDRSQTKKEYQNTGRTRGEEKFLPEVPPPPNVATCPYRLRGPHSCLWSKCKRLLRFERPQGAVTFPRWCEWLYVCIYMNVE